jgi:hypothetical protein
MFHPICTGRGGAFGPQLRSSTPRQAGGHWTVMGMEAEKSMGYLLANGKSPFLMGKPSENHGKMVIYIYIYFLFIYIENHHFRCVNTLFRQGHFQ